MCGVPCAHYFTSPQWGGEDLRGGYCDRIGDEEAGSESLTQDHAVSQPPPGPGCRRGSMGPWQLAGQTRCPTTEATRSLRVCPPAETQERNVAVTLRAPRPPHRRTTLGIRLTLDKLHPTYWLNIHTEEEEHRTVKLPSAFAAFLCLSKFQVDTYKAWQQVDSSVKTAADHTEEGCNIFF